ncbi:hypothetical protein BH11ARM1_BH11ARM1_13570 [soil metagenome]
MNKLFHWLSRKKSAADLAPQYSSWQLQDLARPGSLNGGLPLETYAQMETDSMVQTAITVKKLGVLAAKWSVRPANDSPNARRNADFVNQAFERMEGSPHTILLNAMDAFAKGWSIQESIYAFEAGKWWLAATRPKDPSGFGVSLDRFGRLEGLKLELPGESAVELPISKFVVFAHRGGYANPKGRSDLEAAYPHYVAKTSLLKAWKTHLDRFAMPTMLGSFGTSISQTERNTMLSSLNKLATTKAIVFPKDFDISTIPSDTEASKGFMDAIDYHNREIARAVLGQTLTTDEGRRVGSLALGRVHLQVLLLQLESLRTELADRVMTEQIIRPLIEINFGPGDVPVFEFEKTQIEAFSTGKIT